MRSNLALVITALLIAAIGTPLGAVPIISDVLQRSAPAQQTPAESRYWTGVEALTRRDFKAAEEAFRDSLRLDPAWPGAPLGLADLALTQNRPDDANSWLKKAEALEPRSAAVRTARGRFHFIRGELDRAEAAYKAAIDLDGTAFMPRLDLADLYLSGLWRPQDAVTAYRAAVELNPGHPGARYGLGIALSVTGEQVRALAELERASQLSPTNPLPHRAIGKIYTVRKEYEKALAAIDRGLKSQPNFLDLRLDRAEVLEAKGQVDQAISGYLNILRVDPKFVSAHAKMGELYLRQRNWTLAEAAYLKVVESDPDNSLAYNNLAWMAVERGSGLDDALAWAERAVRLTPNFGAFQDTLGWVYRARGELDKAADVLVKAATSNPSRPEIQYHLGIVYSEQGKKLEAISAFRKALAINSRFSNAEDAQRRIASLGLAQ